MDLQFHDKRHEIHLAGIQVNARLNTAKTILLLVRLADKQLQVKK